MNADCILEGEKVRLRPVREEDLPHFVRWLNDSDVLQWLTVPKGPTHGRGAPVVGGGAAQPQRHRVGHRDAGRPSAGRPGPAPEPLGRWADLGIFIGEKGAWGRGYGTDAVRTILRYAFGG